MASNQHRDPTAEYDTYDEALADIKAFTVEHRWNYKFALLVSDGGKFKTYHRLKQPCWGELRPYTKDEYRPGDLFWPFPKTGTVLAAAFVATSNYDMPYEFMLHGKLSPFRAFGRSAEVIKYGIELGYRCLGFVVTDTNYNPEIMLSFLFCFGRSYWRPHCWNVERNTPEQELAAFLAATDGSSAWLTGGGSLRSLVLAKPNTPADLPSFKDRGAYRRTVIEQIWHDPSEKRSMAEQIGQKAKTPLDHTRLTSAIEDIQKETVDD